MAPTDTTQATEGNNTRFDITRDPLNPQDHLSTGYEGSSPVDYSIPSCEIEDVDVSLFKLFDEKIGFKNAVVPDGVSGPININKPYVIFATGERFALIKKLRPPRNKQKQLMLPAISIRRKSITQTDADMTSRGMNQTTGEIVVKRRLDPQDRDYQNLLNKLSIDNLNPGSPSSSRTQGSNRPTMNPGIREGALLAPKLGNNIWEIITIPQPQFYTATYEITFWTTHIPHMNYLIMTLLAAQLPQGKTFRLNTDKGYWFIATVAKEMSSAENFDDFKEEERIIKYTFQMTVKTFLLAPNGPGNPVPVKRTISATELVFDLSTATGFVMGSDKSPAVADPGFSLTDFEINKDREQTQTINERFRVQKTIYNSATGRNEYKFVKILETNQRSGETVFSASGFKSLDEFIEAIKAT